MTGIRVIRFDPSDLLPESCEECDGGGLVECGDPDCDEDDHVCPECNGFGR